MALRFGDAFESNAKFTCTHCKEVVQHGDSIRYEFGWRRRFHEACAEALIEEHGGNIQQEPKKKGSKAVAEASPVASSSPAAVACQCSDKLKRLQEQIDSLHEMVERLQTAMSWSGSDRPRKAGIDLFADVQ